MGGGEHGARGWLARTRRDARRGVQGGRDHDVPSFGDRARVSHCHGEVTAARPSGARRRARRRHEKGAKGPALPSRLRRTRAGVHACECRGQHRRARDADATRAHRHDAAATERWRRPTARGERLGGWRACRRRRRHLQKMATQPGSMAGITSSGAAARWRGTFRLGSKAAASTGEERRRPHLGGLWPKCRRR
jgi:hypothetical protein